MDACADADGAADFVAEGDVDGAADLVGDGELAGEEEDGGGVGR